MEKQINSNPFEKMGEEEQDRKEQQDHNQAAFAAWQAALTFIALEVLGKEVFDFFWTHKPDFGEVAENEKHIAMQVSDSEKFLFRLADSVAVYVRKNGCFMPSQQVEEFRSLAKSFSLLFWSALKLSNKELWGKSIGIRKLGDQDYILVELPEQQNPFGKIFGINLPGGQE